MSARAGGLADQRRRRVAERRRRAPLPQGAAPLSARGRLRRGAGRRGGRRPALGRARPASGEHARRRRRPDGGARRARRQGVGTCAPAGGRRLGARGRRPQARAPRLPVERGRRSSSTRRSASSARATASGTTAAAATVRRRDPDGLRDRVGKLDGDAARERLVDDAVALGPLEQLAISSSIASEARSKRSRMSVKPTGASRSTPSVPRKSRSPSAWTRAARRRAPATSRPSGA